MTLLRSSVAVSVALCLWAVPVLAQVDHSSHGAAAPAPAGPQDHSAHAAPAADGDEIGTALPPPVPTDYPADRFFPVERMQAARRELAHMGHFTTTVARLDMLEYRAVAGSDGYAWAGEVWTGNDYDRFVLASEGEGAFGEAPEQAELHAKWRHALDPVFNLELGLRQDFRPDPARTYALVGIEGHAPYWIELEGQLFVSNKGDVHARLEASHDWRLTQRVILQPAAEANLALQDVPELGIGAGVERIELGARLRYEFQPEFAPYIGVHWEQRLGRTADFARLDGESASSLAAVVGIRTWF